MALAAPVDAQTILSPPDESISIGSNPSRTGEANDTTVFGPLEEDWARDVGGDVQGVVVADGLVIVAVKDESSFFSKVLALDAATGQPRWEQRVGLERTSVSIGAGDGVVAVAVKVPGENVSINAFAVADGRSLWSETYEEESGFFGSPVVSGGVVYWYVMNDDDDGRLYSFAASTGATVSTPPSILRPEFEISPQAYNPAIGASNSYIAGACGAAAISRASGYTTWESVASPDDCYGTEDAPLLAGDTLIAPNGTAFDAASGAVRASFGASPTLAAFGRTYYAPADAEDVRSVPFNPAEPTWTTPVRGQINARPVISSRGLFVASYDRDYFISSIGPTGGAELYSQEVSAGGPGKELLLAADHLFLTGRKMVALDPVFDVRDGGIDALASGFDFVAGSRVTLGAGLGEALWAQGAEIKVTKDEFPYGKGKPLSVPTFEDGTAFLRPPVKRNTTFRFSAGGDSAQFEIRAYVKVRLTRVRRTSRTRGVIGVRVTKGSPKALAGLRAYGYFGDQSQRTLKRLGVAKLKPGKGAAAASIPFKLLRRANDKDFVYTCIDGLAKRGYGRESKFSRKCGDRKIKFPPKKQDDKRRSARVLPARVLGAAGRDDPRMDDRAPAADLAR